MLIGDIVRRNADVDPGADATVVPGVGTRSWGQTETRSNQLANALLGLGLAKGDRCATFASNAAEYVEFFFACAKSGVIGATTNIRLAPAELQSYLGYVEPTAILVSADQADAARRFVNEVGSLRHVIGFGDGHGFDLDLEEMLAAADASTPSVPVDEDDVYQLGATSGTTGVPKGAILTHRNAIAAMLNWLAEMPVAEGDTNLQCIPMFFNPGGPAQLHPVMTKGGRTVILPGFDPGSFLECVPRYGVTHTTAVPTMIRMVFDHPSCDDRDLSSLKAVVTGGSPVPRDLLVRARAVFGEGVFRPFFGMAETYSCGLVLRPENQRTDGTDDDTRRLSSAGRPHVLMQVRVVDDAGVDVPRDHATPGELWVRGDSVSPGYFRMDDETAASRSDGWFRTGDVAVVDAEGFVSIVDRIKDMIITGGINVFSREVEAVLIAHDAVAQCAVVGVPHPRWGEAIHAVVVPAVGEPEPDVDELLAFAAEHLASYKKPLSLVLVEELPIGGTGKVLKRTLRDRYSHIHVDGPMV